MKRTMPYSRQDVNAIDVEAVVRILGSDFITQGPAVESFQERLAGYAGARHAVVFNSGTSALHAAYHAAGLKSGDEFITSPITFAATANAGLLLGARPVFADVEHDTGNIDPARVEKLVTPKTKLLVAVHYAGLPADMESLREIAQRRNLVLIEDACHALGAKYRSYNPSADGGRGFIGSCEYSDMAVFSFHPVKSITTGEGGAVLTNDDGFAAALKSFGNHGVTKDEARFKNPSDGPWYYEMQDMGQNYRMTDIQAALGASQLARCDAFIARRREIALTYDRAFKDNPWFDLPDEKGGGTAAHHLYPIRLNKPYAARKREIFTSMRRRGLGVQVHYIPVYTHPYYRGLGYNGVLCPEAEEFYRRELSIPLYPSMTDEDVRFVIDTAAQVFGGPGIYGIDGV
jgi:UDP-4-amino-4,6-dideoxy-N-acetyl-beta-L-altrosamine transaminase